MPVFKSFYPDVAIPNKTIPEAIFGTWEGENKDEIEKRVALIDAFTEEKCTFGEFKSLSFKVAKGLIEKGIKKGEVVAIVSPNSISYPSIFNGIILAGGVVTTANPLSSSDDLEKQLKDSNAKSIFTVSLLSEKVNSSAKEGQKVIIVDSDDFKSLTDNDGQFSPVSISPDDLAVLPYSSGTTGLPKGVMINHRSIITNVHQCLILDVLSHDSKTMFAGILPMFHIFGIASLLVGAMMSRHQILVFPRFDFLKLLEGIQNHKITHINIVPPIAVALAKHPVVEKYDLSSLRSINIGAAPLSAQVQEEVFKRTKVVVRQGYGMSETPCGTLISPYSPGHMRKPGSVGILLPNVQAKVISTEDGKELGENERGELWVKCPNMMIGYLNRPDENIIDKDGFLHTGDIGYVDADGDWFIIDRLKELIKYKGYQVPPAELEAIILSHPKVLDVGVVGKPDEEAGELPIAFVVLKPNETLQESELVEFTNSKTSVYKQLRGGVRFVEQIPKSPAGKILRRLLKAQL